MKYPNWLTINTTQAHLWLQTWLTPQTSHEWVEFDHQETSYSMPVLWAVLAKTVVNSRLFLDEQEKDIERKGIQNLLRYASDQNAKWVDHRLVSMLPTQSLDHCWKDLATSPMHDIPSMFSLIEQMPANEFGKTAPYCLSDLIEQSIFPGVGLGLMDLDHSLLKQYMDEILDVCEGIHPLLFVMELRDLSRCHIRLRALDHPIPTWSVVVDRLCEYGTMDQLKFLPLGFQQGKTLFQEIQCCSYGMDLVEQYGWDFQRSDLDVWNSLNCLLSGNFVNPSEFVINNYWNVGVRALNNFISSSPGEDDFCVVKHILEREEKRQNMLFSCYMMQRLNMDVVLYDRVNKEVLLRDYVKDNLPHLYSVWEAAHIQQHMPSSTQKSSKKVI